MKRRRMIVWALLLALLLLTGCTPDESLTVRVRNLPEGESAFLLLCPPDGAELTEDAPEHMKGSELDRLDADGFVCAAYHLTNVLRVSGSQNGQQLGCWFPSAEALRRFCEAYREFRIARCDGEGNVLHISPSVPLCPSGKFAYAVRFECDVRTDAAEVTAWLGKTVLGNSLAEWIFCLMLITLPACALMLVLFAAMRIVRRKTGMKTRACQTVSALCSLPPLLLNLLLLLERTVPYFRTESRLLSTPSFQMVLACDLFWFASLLICGHTYYRSNP